MTDNQGKQIHPGDFFVYAVRDGNSSAMRAGLVLEVTDGGIKTVLARRWLGAWEIIARSQSLDSDKMTTLPPEALDQKLVLDLCAARDDRGYAP